MSTSKAAAPAADARAQAPPAVIKENNTEIGAVLALEENLNLSHTGEVDPYFALVALEWQHADADGSGYLDLKEITLVLSRLNVSIKKKEIKKRFDETDVDNSGTLNFTEFMAFLNDLRNRPEINMIFAEYSEYADSMRPEQFLRFLTESQMEHHATLSDALRIIQICERSDRASRLYLSGFLFYMTSSTMNGWRLREHRSVYHDMTAPLSHYFISSSHNTYASGNQLKSDSSLLMYISALRRGCRCVEIDSWDGPNNEPLVYHGHTLTSRITFRSVIETIRDHAFTWSSMPLILSLENHCSVDQQQVMADIIRLNLGPMIAPPFDEAVDELPSPMALQRKIILKGKVEFEDDEDAEDDSDADDEVVDDADGGKKSKPKKKAKKAKGSKKGSDAGRSPSPLPSGAAGDPRVRSLSRMQRSGSASSLGKSVSTKYNADLAALTHLKGRKFDDFEPAATVDIPAYEMASFSEGKISTIAKTRAGAFVAHNRRFLSRVYPAGRRVDSSNYDPVPSWLLGAQLVALNFQTTGAKMWLNQSFFNDNGNSGYRLKPRFMRAPDSSWRPGDDKEHVMTLIVEVISAWQLPKVANDASDIIDPYVIVEILGVPADRASMRTKTIKNNGFNPVWNAEFEFSVTCPELAVLMIKVHDKDVLSADDFIGYAGLPIESVASGYRHIDLVDFKDEPMEGSSLLCRFRFL